MCWFKPRKRGCMNYGSRNSIKDYFRSLHKYGSWPRLLCKVGQYLCPRLRNCHGCQPRLRMLRIVSLTLNQHQQFPLLAENPIRPYHQFIADSPSAAHTGFRDDFFES